MKSLASSLFDQLIFAQADALPVETTPPFGWQNVVEGNGVAISLTGMLIVFCALTIISLFIAALPHVLAALDPWLPEMHHPHAKPTTALRKPSEQTAADEEKMIAAIGYALHQRTQHQRQKHQ